VADIEAQTRLKGSRGRQVVDLTMQLLAYDLLISTYWMDVRKVETPSRNFGQTPTAVWTAFRKVVPFQQDIEARPNLPFSVVAYDFLKSNTPSSFYPAGPAMQATDGQRLEARPASGK